MWAEIVGKELLCQRERANSEDPFAVAVRKGKRMAGHVPIKISTVCLMFPRQKVWFSVELLDQGAIQRIYRKVGMKFCVC